MDIWEFTAFCREVARRRTAEYKIRIINYAASMVQGAKEDKGLLKDYEFSFLTKDTEYSDPINSF